MHVTTLGKHIIKIHRLSLIRYKMNQSIIELYLQKYGIRYIPDWIGIFFILFFAIIISNGVSSESTVDIDSTASINIPILCLSTSVLTILFSLATKIELTPNISILLQIIPITKRKRKLAILYSEIFNYKKYIFICQFIALPLFTYFYDLNNSLLFLIKAEIVLFLIYTLSCQISLFIKGIVNDKIAKVTKGNYYIATGLILVVIIIVVKDSNIFTNLTTTNFSLINLLVALGVSNLLLFWYYIKR